MQRTTSAGQVSESELDAILMRYGDAKSGTLTQAEGAVLRVCIAPILAGLASMGLTARSKRPQYARPSA